MSRLDVDAAAALARAALPAWGFTDAKLELASQSENTVYRVHAAADECFALRIHRPGYHDLDALNAELAFCAALAEAGVRVPRARRALDGRGFVLATAPGGESCYVSMIEWVAGQRLHDVMAAAAEGEVERHCHALGGVAASIHNHADGWRPPAGFRRHALDADGLLGHTPFWGAFWEHPSLSAAQRRLVLAGARRLHAALVAYGKGRDRYGLIHADLHPHNVLVDGEALTVIDFDDAGYGWHAYELAVAMFGHRADPRLAAMLDALVAGYRAVRPLDDRAVAAVPAFMAIRAIALLGWLKHRPEMEHGRAYAAELIEYACLGCERLLSLPSDAVI